MIYLLRWSDLKNVLITEIKALRSWCMHKGIGIDLQLEVAEVLSDVKWLSFIIRQIFNERY